MQTHLDVSLMVARKQSCSRLVIIKPQQAMQMHPGINLMMATRQQTYSIYFLQPVRLRWLCRVQTRPDYNKTYDGSTFNIYLVNNAMEIRHISSPDVLCSIFHQTRSVFQTHHIWHYHTRAA